MRRLGAPRLSTSDAPTSLPSTPTIDDATGITTTGITARSITANSIDAATDADATKADAVVPVDAGLEAGDEGRDCEGWALGLGGTRARRG